MNLLSLRNCSCEFWDKLQNGMTIAFHFDRSVQPADDLCKKLCWVIEGHW